MRNNAFADLCDITEDAGLKRDVCPITNQGGNQYCGKQYFQYLTNIYQWH